MKSTLFFLLLFSGRFICITFVSVGGVCGLLAGGAVYAVSSASLICSSCISSSPFLVGKGMCILPSGTTSDSLSFFFLSFFPSFLLPSHVTLGVYSCFFWDNGRRLSANPLMGSSARSCGRGGNEGGRGSESPLRISGLITLGSFAIKDVINYATNDVMFTHYYGGPVRLRKMMIMVRMISIRLIIIMMMLMRMM